MALGLVLLGLAYGVMVVGAARSDQGMLVSPWFLVSFYFVYSLGELCFLPAGFSFVGQTAPIRLASMLMGIWFTANFVANLIDGYLAGMVEPIERGELFRVLGGQADFFLIFVIPAWWPGAFSGPWFRRSGGSWEHGDPWGCRPRDRSYSVGTASGSICNSARRAEAAISSLSSCSIICCRRGTAALAAGPISSRATVTGKRTDGAGSSRAMISAGTAAAAAGPRPAIS